jgi:hypothetical protein
MKKRVPDGFDAWVLRGLPTGVDPVNIHDKVVDAAKTPEDFDAAIKTRLEGNKNHPYLRMNLAGRGANLPKYKLDLNNNDFTLATSEAPDRSYISYFMLQQWQQIEISNGVIQQLNLHKGLNEVILTDCFIGRLEVVVNDCSAHLTLKDCVIGELVLKENSFSFLDVQGGAILNIKTPAADAGNPFTGHVSLNRNTFFPVKGTESKLFEGAHGYRAIRKHLESLENAPMAAFVRAKELEAERVHDRGLSNFVSWLYGFFAGYGQKPAMPLVWLLFAYVATGAILVLVDGGTLGYDSNHYKGVWVSLIGDDCSSRFARSFTLPLQSFSNPLGWVSPRKLVVTTNIIGSFVLILHALFSATMVFLTALSLRRRFKLTH